MNQELTPTEQQLAEQAEFFAPQKEIIRTLGFYQPFCSLMLHGKIETRWVREGKKPPFPLGKYLLYSTQKETDGYTLFQWCGVEMVNTIRNITLNDETRDLKGYAIAIGELTKVRLMSPTDEATTFVKFVGRKYILDKNDTSKAHQYLQWCLEFENVQAIEPFAFKGKQGVGILKPEQYRLIQHLQTNKPKEDAR